MPIFRVCIVESREYIHEVEATTADEAAEIAKDDEDVEHSLSDSFRERIVDWTEEVK